MRTSARSLLGPALVAGAAAVALAACSGTPPHEVMTTDADESACEDVLSGERMQELTGEQGAFRTKELDDLPACQALIDGQGTSRVSVVRVPATDWASTVSDRVGYLAGTGEITGETEQLAGKLAQGELSGAEACTLFGYLAEFDHDSPADANLVVAETPRGALEVMTAQSCVDATYTMVEFESTDEWADEDAVRAGLTAAIEELNPDAALSG